MMEWVKRAAGVAVSTLTAAGAHAESATYVGLSFASDDVASDVTQNAGQPALQGHIEQSFGGGFHAGVWFSQVDFSKSDLTDDFEIDAYLSYRGEELWPDLLSVLL